MKRVHNDGAESAWALESSDDTGSKFIGLVNGRVAIIWTTLFLNIGLESCYISKLFKS